MADPCDNADYEPVRPSPGVSGVDPLRTRQTPGLRSWLLVLVVLIGGCGTNNEVGPQSRARVAAFDLTAEHLDSLSIELETDAGTVTITGEELSASDDYAQLHTAWVDISGDELVVRFAVGPVGAQLVAGEVVLEVIADWEWEVQFHIAALDPADTCFGCQGSRAFDLLGGDDKRLFVVWGGNSISDPVAY